MQTEIYDFAFKHALAAMDEVINLAPTQEQRGDLLEARIKLLDARAPNFKTAEARKADRVVTPPATLAPKSYAPWTWEEEQNLAREWNNNIPVRDIAQKHGRKVGAIASKLQKMNLIANKEKFLETLDVEPREGLNSEKVSESFVKSSRPSMSIKDRYEGAVLVQDSGRLDVDLDFTGEWICENGETAEVQNFEGGSWVGSRKGVGTTIWDPNGCHVTPGWNLKDRIRQGKNYK